MTTDTHSSTFPASAIAAYAPRLYAIAGESQYVVSPLGAWLLPALVAPLATGADRDELERVLGCDADAARRIVDALLAAPHPAAAAALAVWTRHGALGDALAAWARSMPEPVSVGEIPSRAEADAWAERHTRGLIPAFPGGVDDGPEARLLLASAIASKVGWENEFMFTHSHALGAPWAERVKTVLWTHAAADRMVARTAAAGLVGVQVQRGKGLAVVSVIAAPEVGMHDVLAAAHEVAALESGLPSPAGYVGAFDLPLAGHSWTVHESEFKSMLPGQRMAFGDVALPAWRAEASIKRLLASPGTGYAAAVRALVALLPPDPRGHGAHAIQVARAEFEREGFTAAAVTKLEMYAGSAPHWGLPVRMFRAVHRNIRLRFGRAFAVVAVAMPADGASSAWTGVPVFGAWITEPAEPKESAGPGRPHTMALPALDGTIPRDEWPKRWARG